MAKFIITRDARDDITEIVSYIADDNIDAALAFHDRLIEIFELLSENTKIGRERPDLREGVRSIPEGNYIIFYRSWAGQVAIVRVLHSARDLEEFFY